MVIIYGPGLIRQSLNHKRHLLQENAIHNRKKTTATFSYFQGITTNGFIFTAMIHSSLIDCLRFVIFNYIL